MFEYEIMAVGSDDIYYIYGYTYLDACERNNLDPNNYKVFNFEYVD